MIPSFEPKDPALKEVLESYNRGIWLDSREKLVSHVKEYANTDAAQVLLSRISVGLMRFKEGYQCANAVPEDSPLRPYAEREAIQALIGSHDFAAAAKSFKSLLDKDWWTDEALVTGSILATALKSNELGIKLIKLALALAPSMAEAYANMAVVKSRMQANEEAIQYSTIAFEMKPFLPGNAGVLANLYRKMEEYDSAKGVLNQLIKLQPWYLPAHIQYAELCQTQGDQFGAALGYWGGLSSTKFNSKISKVLAVKLAAVRLHRAADILMKINLATDPNNRKIWDNFAQNCVYLGRRTIAGGAFQRSLWLEPKDKDALYNWGVFCTLDGNYEDAVKVATTLVEEHPEYVKGYMLLSDAYLKSGKPEEAAEAIEKSKELLGELDAVALTQQAAVFIQQEKRNDALNLLEKAIILDPSYYLAVSRLAELYKDQERYDQALEMLIKARDLRPGRVDADIKIGRLYSDRLEHEKALEIYRKSFHDDPESTAAAGALANQLIHMGRWDEAEAATRHLLELKPLSPYGLLILAEIQLNTKRLEEAMANCAYAISVNPQSQAPYEMVGQILKRGGYPHLAMPFFWRAHDLKPDSPRRKFNLALHILYGADFKHGWPLYEYGFDVEKLGRQPFRSYEPPVLSENDLDDLEGKTVLLWAEQGVGDHIMFMSIAHELVNRGATLMIESEIRLAPLLRRSFPGSIVYKYLKKLNPQGNKADFHLGMGSLPLLFRQDQNSFKGQKRRYLAPDPVRTEALRKRYQPEDGQLLVGIGWRGGKQLRRQETRSVPMENWGEVLSVPNVKFVCIQYGDVAGDIARLKELYGVDVIHDRSIDPLKDLDGAAAQIAALDLVITASNAGAHTAGGLGVPCWTIVPLDSDWRWTWGRTDCLWYPGMKIYRKRSRHDWFGVMSDVATDLRKLVLENDQTVLRHSSWDNLDPAGIALGSDDVLETEDIRDMGGEA